MQSLDAELQCRLECFARLPGDLCRSRAGGAAVVNDSKLSLATLCCLLGDALYTLWIGEAACWSSYEHFKSSFQNDTILYFQLRDFERK